MKILFDPSLIWFEPYENEKFVYLEEVVELINNFLNLHYFTSDLFLQYLNTFQKKPFGDYKETGSRKRAIISTIFKSIEVENIVKIKEYVSNTSIIIPKSMKCVDNGFNECFEKTLCYLIDQNIECVLFLSLYNSLDNTCTYTFKNIYTIKHVYKEIGSYLAQLISEGVYINNNVIKQPTLKNPLPNKTLVKEYTEIRKKTIENGEQSKDFYLKISKEVILRNGYAFDEYLTKINNSAIREVFKSKTKPVIYLSTDVEHGAIEVFDSHAIHQGECTYTGEIRPCSKDPQRHKLKLKK